MSVILETPRLILRQFTQADATLILQLNSVPDIVKYVHEPILKTESGAKHILENIILPQYENNPVRWAIHTKAGNEFIGWCGLKHLPESDDIDLGYRLRKACWGKGYATEAARYTLFYGFNTIDLYCITGSTYRKHCLLKSAGKYRDAVCKRRNSCPLPG